MAVACPVDLDTQKLRDEIRSIYARVATDPSGEFHFHRGPQYATEFLNYDRGALDQLPKRALLPQGIVGVFSYALLPLVLDVLVPVALHE